eukprot:c34246_g1_i1.p1 GENE.c34246_g1_i1~~c34246_g1_i1.p1  ORF type:complete len:114 (-),score=22.32 c34246_g1_i1:571-885(-)
MTENQTVLSQPEVIISQPATREDREKKLKSCKRKQLIELARKMGLPETGTCDQLIIRILDQEFGKIIYNWTDEEIKVLIVNVDEIGPHQLSQYKEQTNHKWVTV